jgi:hypothetical protein
MLYKLQNVQIPKYWEIIKFAAVNADEIKYADVPDYCVRLLLDLLNTKVECILSLDKDKNIQRVLLVSMIEDEVTKDKKLMLRNIYSFVKSPPNVWKEETGVVFEWAKKTGCTKVFLTTANRAVAGLANLYGMSEASKNFNIDL